MSRREEAQDYSQAAQAARPDSAAPAASATNTLPPLQLPEIRPERRGPQPKADKAAKGDRDRRTPPGPAPHKAGWRLSPKLLVFEVLAFLVFAALAGAGFLAWRLSQGPIDLEFFRPGIEKSLTDARSGQPVKIHSLVLEWSQDRAKVEVAARDVTALDLKGQVVSRADKAVITFDTAALLSGKLKTRRLRLENGRASVHRSKDGVWTFANIEVFKEPKSDKPFNLLTDLKWATLAQPVRAVVSAGQFERVDLVNFSLDVSDEGSGMHWSANPVGGVWSAGPDGVTLDLDVRLAGGGGAAPNRVRIGLASDAAVTKATAKLTLDSVDPALIAAVAGASKETFTSNKPASASFTIAASEAKGLDEAKLSLSGVSGKVTVAGVDANIADLAFDAVFDPQTERVDLTNLKIASDRANGAFAGSIDVSRFLNGHVGQGTPFKLSGKDFQVAATPYFETPWPFGQAAVEGEISGDAQKLQLSSIDFTTGAAHVKGTGEMWLDGPENARLMGAKFDVRVDGAVTPQQVVAFWPQGLGTEARLWAKEHVLAGKGSNVVAHIDWPPGANAKGYIDNPVVKVDFDVADAIVSYLHDFPAVTGASGKGHLEGNRLSFDVSAGKVGQWTVDEGKVAIPEFHPATAIDITGQGRGDARDLMRMLEASDLKTGTKYGLNIEGMGGTGGLEFKVNIPVAKDSTDDDIKYTVTGGFREAAAPDLAMGFGLTDSNVRVEMNETMLHLSGGGKFGPAQTVFDWKESFMPGSKDDTSQSQLSANAIVTPDMLNALGYAARTMMQGEADVQLKASGSGRAFSSITADLDLTKAQIDIAELGWTKKFDAPAKGTFRYGGDSAKGVITGDIKSDGLELSGDAELNGAGELQTANIERIYSRGSVDLHGTIAKKGDGGLRVSLSGPFFDASPWMDGFLSMKDEPAAAASPGAQPQPSTLLQLNADKLRLREDADLLQAKVQLDLTDKGPRSGTITGLAGPGKKIDVKITPDGEARNIAITSGDAGFGARVLMKANYLVGGSMTLNGRFEGSGGKAEVTMADVRLKDAPLLAQILSLASLRGLTDVMNGDGVLFTKVEAPLTIKGGRIDIAGLRASGPAMGITARGWVQPAEGGISLDGVLVPSFGLNSALGAIPIFGDLFVSRQGEGVFSPTYSVRGTLSEAHIAINPVAGITPGVVRRIFENPSEPPPAGSTTPAATPTPSPSQSPLKAQGKQLQSKQ